MASKTSRRSATLDKLRDLIIQSKTFIKTKRNTFLNYNFINKLIKMWKNKVKLANVSYYLSL